MNDRAVELLRKIVDRGSDYYELDGLICCRLCSRGHGRHDTDCSFIEAEAFLAEIDAEPATVLNIASTY